MSLDSEIHEWLCVGALAENHSLVLFKVECARTNPGMFVMAAKACVGDLVRRIRGREIGSIGPGIEVNGKGREESVLGGKHVEGSKLGMEIEAARIQGRDIALNGREIELNGRKGEENKLSGKGVGGSNLGMVIESGRIAEADLGESAGMKENGDAHEGRPLDRLTRMGSSRLGELEDVMERKFKRRTSAVMSAEPAQSELNRTTTISSSPNTQTTSPFDLFQMEEWHNAVAFDHTVEEDAMNEMEFRDSLKVLAKKMQELLIVALMDMSNLLKKNVTLQDIQTSCSKFSKYCGCFERNQFEVCIEPDDKPCGQCIFSLCCMANHDCDPNVELVFLHGTNEASLRALKPIKAGEEVCVSYIDTSLSLEERRRELADYGFQCSCAKCLLEDGFARIQMDMANRVVMVTQSNFDPKRVAGFDISFESDPDKTSVACLVVLSLPDLKTIYESCEDVKLTEPYIPGFLAMREAPVFKQMLAKVPANVRPDVVVFDGCGVLHPRACGLASHVGVECDIPTIGVAKNFLAVDGLSRDSVKKMIQQARLENASQDEVPVIGKSGRVWGNAYFAPGADKKPVYVSVGHKLDLPTAMQIVRAVSVHRVPEPVRRADFKGREEVQKRKKARLNLD